jgi:hypothetical protein
VCIRRARSRTTAINVVAEAVAVAGNFEANNSLSGLPIIATSATPDQETQLAYLHIIVGMPVHIWPEIEKARAGRRIADWQRGFNIVQSQHG